MIHFRSVKLAELATVRSGFAFKSVDWKPSGVPVIKIRNITPGDVTLENCGFVNEALAVEASSYEAQLGDPLISMSGATVGEIGRVRFKFRALVNQRVGIFRVKSPTQLNQDFLYHFLQLPETIDYFVSSAYGSAQPNISPTLILNVDIPLPPIHEQRAIAEVLGALDDKIAANTKLAATAEELSHTLFRSMLYKDARSEPLAGTAQFVNGKAFTKNATGTGRVVIRIAELNSGIGGSTVYNDIEVDEKHLAVPGSILFAWSGSLTLHRWYRPEGIVNQHIFKVIPADGYPEWLIFELLRQKLDEFKSIAADKATTMGHIQRKHLDAPVLIPSSEIIAEHASLMQALWQQSLNASMEKETLAATRDALLPQLMSGKLRVKDAERVVSAAV